MVFVRAVDVEEFEPGGGFEQVVALCPEIKAVFGVAVHVERAELIKLADVVLIAGRTVAVCCCTGCVNETDVGIFFFLDPFGDAFGVKVVVAEQVVGVGFGGGAVCSHVNDGFNAGQCFVFEQFGEGGNGDDVVKTESGEVAPFSVVGVAEIVDNENLVDAKGVECVDHRTADKSGSACYNKHGSGIGGCGGWLLFKYSARV